MALRSVSLGLLGQLLAILLLAVGIEFAASTILYEQSSRALIRDDEAHRLAEHLVIARKLIAEQPWPERPDMAARLTTNRYDIHWAGMRTPPPPSSEERGEAFTRVLEWEPSLRDGDLRVQLVRAGPQAQLFGALRLADGTWMRFRAADPVADGQPAWRRIELALLPAMMLLLVGTVLFSHTVRPVRMLARAAESIGPGREVVVPETGPPDVRHLIRAFNAMQARIRQLIADRTQALAAVGHDLRTPLARMQLRADAIPDAALRRALATDVGEMEAMVQSLLSYLGGDEDPEQPVRTDVAIIAATIVDDAGDHGADARYIGDDHLEAVVRPIGLKRAIANLVENAIHYGGSARVSVTADGETILIRVDDGGPGIPEDRLDEVLHPFARLDPARSRNTSGLGLGLAIVLRAAEKEGGTLLLCNKKEGGLRAELRLPRR